MVKQTEPGADISAVLWRRKVEDGLKGLLAWSDTIKCNREASKFNNVRGKHKLLRVEGNAIRSTHVQHFDGMEEGLLDVSVPETGIVNTLDASLDV